MKKTLNKVELSDTQLSALKEMLYTGKVKIARFGIFTLREIKARRYFSVVAKQDVMVAKHLRVKFQPLEQVRRDLKKLCLK